MSDATFDRVTASRIDIVDSEGRIRIIMGAKDDGAASVMICDHAGAARLQLSLLSDGTAKVLVSDDRQIGRIQLAVGTDPEFPGGGIVMFNDNSRPWFLLAGDGGPASFMVAVNPDGTPRWQAFS